MPRLRHHGATLVAGLVFLGVLLLFAVFAQRRLDLDAEPIAKGAVWFAGAFIAALLTRRMLVELDVASTCVAFVVVIAVALGIKHEADDEPFGILFAAQLGVTVIGSLMGALALEPPRRPRTVFLRLGAGAAGLGAAMIGVGLAQLASKDVIVLGLVLGAVTGGLLAARVTTAGIRDTALGQSAMFTLLGACIDPGSSLIAILMACALGGLIFGGAGGWLGVKLRSRARPDLPEARQVE